MTPHEHALIGQARRIARECERFFRMRLFEAITDDERSASSVGLRHAVGLKKALERMVGSSQQGSPRGSAAFTSRGGG
jgi:hypothetical protein